LPSNPTSESLSARGKTVYALGDHTVNLVLSAAAILYLPFLMNHGGLSPALAGFVFWIARITDAVTDPGMGRLSDTTRWKSGRRRPYFLIGALPLGFFFALMWLSVPFESELLRFAYYTTTYVCVSLAMTCVSVPYLALLPEMATDYDDRTSFNAFRAAAAVMGTLVAVSMEPIANAMGGGPEAWWHTALMMGVWVVLPWYAVHAVSFERPGYQKNEPVAFLEGARALIRHRAFRTLAGFYLLARIAVDLIGAMFLFYFTYSIGRPEDFAPCLGIFLGVVILVLPAWLSVARKRDKRSIFVFGAAWWSASQVLIFLGDPDWPRWVMFAIPAVAALGYAVADLMPWAMLGDVIDEDELATGERREGMYVGCFMFLRKVGGATAVLAIGLILQLAGFVGDGDRSEQPELALLTIRTLTSLVPMALLLLAIAVATRYPLTREVHAEILEGLRRRRERP
jgi:GPH family glycoside/pentoside/hexuronide:cation symporter